MFQKQFRHNIDVDHVKAALAVSEFYDLAEDGEHDPVAPLLLIYLGSHQIQQTPLLRVQLDGIEDTLVYYPGVEGTGNVVGHAILVGFLDKLTGILTGNHDDRDIFDPLPPVHH